MDWTKHVRQHYEKELAFLKSAWEKAKQSRDNAPGAMESHSDVSKSEYENIAASLAEDMKKLEEYIAEIPQVAASSNGVAKKWSYVELKLAGKVLNVFLVPEGMGGKTMDEVRIISVESPLGAAIVGKSAGYNFDLNDQNGELVKVE